jgi:uncharacterized membrane protein YdjX (TVP38/TMEM64 family)
MKTKNKFLIFITFLIVSIIVAIVSGYFGLNPSSLENFIYSNYILSAVIYLISFVILTSFSFSVSIMTTFGAYFFSIYLAIILSIVGILGSSIIDFYISRKLGKDYVRNYLEKRGGKIEKFDDIIEKNTFKTILILSAIFFVPPTIPNLLGGILKIDLKNYIIATFLGNIANTIFTVLLINAFLYLNILQIYISIIGLILTSLIAIYFYKGELRDILMLSFPFLKKFRL